MQVTETRSEGLKHEFRVVVPASDLDSKLFSRLEELKGRVRINGFRPGKVPLDHLKRIYGRAVMAETIDEAVRDANNSIASEHGFRLAIEPKVTLPTEEGEVKAMVEGKADLSYTVAMEVLPQIELADFKGLTLEKLTAEVSDAEVDEALQRVVDQNRPFQPKEERAAAEKGDKVTVSFSGTIDGAPFQGGAADDIGVEIGSGTFIPGFEEQLEGAKAGETRTITATFPPNYLNTELAGKTAQFEVMVKSIEAPGAVSVDDEFAKSMGLESLDKLKQAIKDRLAQEHAGVSRRRLKRALLDQLDERHRFELPPTMVEEEFQNVWRTVIGDLQSQGRTLTDENTTEEAAQAEYRTIAERRVRLGLVLAEIGEKNNIKVSDEEVTRAVVERARQLPGQEQRVWEYYRNNPNALASLRAPIYEEKVVDFLLELAKVTEAKVTRQELYKEDEGESA